MMASCATCVMTLMAATPRTTARVDIARPVQAQLSRAASLAAGRRVALASGARSRGGAGRALGLSTVCMAHPKRVARVQQQLKREVSTLFVTDKVLRSAIYPRESVGSDFALTSLASVTDLQLSNDLQVAKVYVSVYAEDSKKEETMEALYKLEGYTRKKISQKVRLRLTPEIRFILDDSYQRATKVLSVLEKLEMERKLSASMDQGTSDDMPDEWKDLDPSEYDDDEDEVDDRDNIIVVT